MFVRAGFVGADWFLAKHVAAKSKDRIKRHDNVHIPQKQPDVVIGRFPLSKLLDLLFVGKHLRQLGRQFWLVAAGKLLEANLGVLEWRFVAHKTFRRPSENLRK